MAKITFDAALFTLRNWIILQLPAKASAKLPSRGQVMVEGSFNGVPFKTALEPDGKWSHWFKVDPALLAASGQKIGDTIRLSIEPIKVWPEPEIPDDLQKALNQDSEANSLWQIITPMARWEWIRWIRSTGKDETRKKRIEVACSKLRSGKRRPCCWNRNLCTEPSVSKNGVLLEPAGSQ